MHGQTFSFESQRSVFTATLKGEHSGLKKWKKKYEQGVAHCRLRLRGCNIRCFDLQLFFSIFWCFKKFQSDRPFYTLMYLKKRSFAWLHFSPLWHSKMSVRGQTVQNIFFCLKKRIRCHRCLKKNNKEHGRAVRLSEIF